MTLLLPLLLAAAASPRLLHTPVASAPAGVDLEIRADADPPLAVRRITLHVRGAGTAFSAIDLQRSSDGRYVAQIPAAIVRPPAVEYFLTWEDVDDVERAAFASAAWPHTVVVQGSPLEDAAVAELRRRGGRRSEIRAIAELVSFDRAHDAMWRAETGYRYALLGMVDEVGIAAGVLRGSDPEGALRAFHYGASEIALRAGPYLSLGARLLLGANQEAFGAGVEGRVAVGRPGATQAELSAGTVDELGWWSRFGLQWDTVPGVLLRAGVELTTLPSQGDAAVRLLTGAEVPIGGAFALTATAGYQARGPGVGGPAAGMGGAVRF